MKIRIKWGNVIFTLVVLILMIVGLINPVRLSAIKNIEKLNYSETTAKKIVKEQLDNLTETDKDRLFYVLTHSGSSKFINHKEGKIDFIKQNYGSKIKVLTYADSLLYTFLTEFKDSVDGLDEFQDFEQPINWADDEWDAIMDVLSKAQRNIKKKEILSIMTRCFELFKNGVILKNLRMTLIILRRTRNKKT